MAERARHQIKYGRSLGELSVLEQVQAGEKVAATMDTPGWEIIVDLLEQQQQKILSDLLESPKVLDAAEYAARLGEARGIAIALDAGPSVLHRAELAQVELIEMEGAPA